MRPISADRNEQGEKYDSFRETETVKRNIQKPSGASASFDDVNPNPCEGEVNEGRKETNTGENCFDGGAVFLSLEIVHLRSDDHRYIGLIETISKHQRVSFGVVYSKNGVEARFPFERPEVVDDVHKIGIERARDFSEDELLKHVHPRVRRAEEESGLGQVEVRVLVRESDPRDVELKATGVTELKLIDGDYGAVVGTDIRKTNLSETKRNKK
ncbi:hypothetical protein V6N13_086284 [Hibiscus sabdariffa]|uniref:Uncharacterized protein n=1 Tax=Hibiscus sabdariffa TaxID=183260 RepID=A0ABR2FSR3_9ROSI